MDARKILGLIVATVLMTALLPMGAFAETTGKIDGTVVDAETGKPLVGANVVLQETELGATVDKDGTYAIPDVPAGRYKVAAVWAGYGKITKEVAVSADEVTTIHFELEETGYELEEFVVVAPTEIATIKHSPMTVTVMDVSELRGRFVTLNQVLNRATGVKIRQEGALGSDARIAIHGMEGKRVKVFIDDSPLNTPDGSLGINDIPIQLIERIEIYKGVVPARLGGDAIGGAVNVVTREYESDYVDVTYSPGSHNTHRASWIFQKELPGPGIKFGTGGFFNYSDNDYSMDSPFQPGLTITRDHDAYLAYVVGVVGSLTKAWFDKIELELVKYGNRKEIQGIQTNIRFAETKGVLYFAALALEKEGFFLDNLDFDFSLGIPVFRASFIDTSHYRYHFDGTQYPSPHGQGEIGWDPHDSKDTQYDVRQRLNLNYRLNDTHGLNLNTVASYSSREPDDPLASEHAGYNIGDYPSETYRIISGLTHEMALSGGETVNSLSAKCFHIHSEIAATGRMQRSLRGTPSTIENSRTKFGISEAFRHRVHPSLNLKASAEHAMRLPDSKELFGDGVMITPAPKLTPEVSENVNVGVMFDREDVLGMPRLEAEVNGFFRYTHDMIKLGPGADGLTFAHVNLGEVRTLGADAEVKADLSKAVYAYANATYQDLRDVREYVAGTKTPNPTKDKRVPNIPWFYCNFGVELHKEDFFGPGQFGKVFWEGGYVEEFFYAWEMSRYQRRRIPSCFQQTVGLEYSFFNNGVILSAEVHNLTDAKALDIYNRPRPGRTVHMNLRYSWFREALEGRRRKMF